MSPGPGSYNLKSSLKEKRISFGTRASNGSFIASLIKASKDVPPPASYNPSYLVTEN
jgi:hypothetical protein